MPLTLFTESKTCKGRAACVDCRNSRAFRESLRNAWTLPSDDVDFACPFGVPMGATQEDIPDAPKPTPPEPVPFDEWPKWARLIADRREPEDKGVGDTIHRLLGRFGVAFKATLKALGVPCGCDRRRREWNVRYGY